jgi:hypothetical protein
VSVAVLWRELKLLSGFHDVKLAKLKLKIVSILIVLQAGCRDANMT